jgi:hypothetical protein
MAEGSWPSSEEELERALAELGAQLAYPPTPDLTGAVRQRLLAPDARRQEFRARRASSLGRGRRVGLAVAALLLFGSGVLAGSLGAGTAVARWLGLPGVRISYLSGPPTPLPPSVGGHLQLGQRVLLPRLPELGTPEELYLGGPPPGGQLALVYRARPGLPAAGETGVGLLLTEFPGALREAYVQKGLGADARLEMVLVDGNPGYWISGHLHFFWYTNPATGQATQESLRLAGNTLLWEQDGLTLRLESALSMRDALRVAASVR